MFTWPVVLPPHGPEREAGSDNFFILICHLMLKIFDILLQKKNKNKIALRV